MNLSGMSYMDVMGMPVDSMHKYIDWKIKYDEEVDKARQKALDSYKYKGKKR